MRALRLRLPGRGSEVVGVKKLFLLATLLFAPSLAVNLPSAVTAWKPAGDIIYLGTEDGGVYRYRPAGDELEKLWQLPPLQLVTGKVQPKIYSLDLSHGKLLWVREGQGGFRVVEVFEPDSGDPPRVLVPDTLELPVVSAWFSGDGVLLVLLDGEVAWADGSGNIGQRLQVTGSAVGAAAFNGELLAIGDEGGLVSLVDAASRRLLNAYPMQRDKVLSLALGKSRVVSGGRDRRAAVLDLASGNILKLKASFFVMAVALSPDENLVAYTYDESGVIRLVDLAARREVARSEPFPGVGAIAFLDENTLLLSDDQGKLWSWRWR